jgi:hypothetical protein
MEYFLLIVTRAEYLRHDVQLMVVVLGGLGQLRCDVEFLIRYYALLKMRPLSISCVEDFVVISCGKVDYDKSG